MLGFTDNQIQQPLLSDPYQMSPDVASAYSSFLKMQLEIQKLTSLANACKYDQRVKYWKDKYLVERDGNVQKKALVRELEQRNVALQRKVDDFQEKYGKLKKMLQQKLGSTSLTPLPPGVQAHRKEPESPLVPEPNVSPILHKRDSHGISEARSHPSKGKPTVAQLNQHQPAPQKESTPIASQSNKHLVEKSSISARTVEPSEIFNSEEEKELSGDASLESSLDTQELLKSDADEMEEEKSPSKIETQEAGANSQPANRVAVFEEKTPPDTRDGATNHSGRKRGRSNNEPENKQRRKRQRLDLGEPASDKKVREQKSPTVALKDRTNSAKLFTRHGSNSLLKEMGHSVRGDGSETIAQRNASVV